MSQTRSVCYTSPNYMSVPASANSGDMANTERPGDYMSDDTTPARLSAHDVRVASGAAQAKIDHWLEVTFAYWDAKKLTESDLATLLLKGIDFCRRLEGLKCGPARDQLWRAIYYGMMGRLSRQQRKVLYALYRQTGWWKELREQALRTTDHHCVVCGARTNIVHHVTYTRLFAEQIGDLMPLCKDCHSAAHGIEEVA